jgi:predicted RNA-binding Zn-ribbon protein involved in translation (DUF1610 family)
MTASERIREAREERAWTCPKCGQVASAHNRGKSCETLATYYGFTTKAAYDAVQRDKAASPWFAA